MAREPVEFTAPLGSASRGRLEFARCASGVTIHADGGMQDLVRARFTSVVPMVLADDGKVTIEYPRFSPSEWLRPNRRAADVTLSAAVPWELVFSGGVTKLRADLTGVALRSLEIRSGASDVEVVLPEPEGVVAVRVGSGASKVAIRRPSGAAAVLRVGGGVTKLVFDGERYGAMGGSTRLLTPRAEEAPDRFEIDIGGGASALTVTEREGRVTA